MRRAIGSDGCSVITLELIQRVQSSSRALRRAALDLDLRGHALYSRQGLALLAALSVTRCIDQDAAAGILSSIRPEEE